VEGALCSDISASEWSILEMALRIENECKATKQEKSMTIHVFDLSFVLVAIAYTIIGVWDKLLS
jgi:hypothetical protein